MRRIVALGLAVAGTALFASCYTQIQMESEYPPAEPVKRSPSLSPYRGGGENSVLKLIGEYSGYSLLVDETGHHTGDARFAFDDSTYRCEGDHFQSSQGTYTVSRGAIVLVDTQEPSTGADVANRLQGRFELQRTGAWLQLVQRNASGSGYREIGLSPVATEPN
jgi:hypothetical protein